MPDCTAEQNAANLALATKLVRAAEWAVEAAEASLAWMAFQSASTAYDTALMALQQCQMSGMGGGMRQADPEDQIVTLQRRHIDNLKNEVGVRRRKCDLLLAMQATK